MDIYQKVTGTGLFCFDTQLTLVTVLPENISVYNYNCLGMNRLISFLAETFSQVPSKNRYYAYFLHNSIICHIVFLVRNNRYTGAFVSEPVLVKQMTESEIKSFGSYLKLPPEGSTDLLKVLSKARIIPYERAMTFGTVLFSLSQTLYCEDSALQVIRSPHKIFDSLQEIRPASLPDWNAISSERHTPAALYQSIKCAIQEGDVDKLLKLMNKSSAANAPMHQLHRTDHVRSIKNSFIKACSMACYAAIEANAPYAQTLDIADDMILKMEAVNNIAELYELMKAALLEFARAVLERRKYAYSKPIRKVMDYLYAHYSEKITLDDLSKITNLSTYYISNLIKTETGLSLHDNINKIRIEKSQKLLLERNSSILEITQSVGYRYQNHFAAIFKRYTGITPTEYRNAMGSEQIPNSLPAEKTGGGETISLALQQLKTKLTVFSGTFDIARIVDPLDHNSWILHGQDLPDSRLICYSFWNKNQSCENCISIRAYIQNDTFFKIEQKNSSTFLVLAFPQNVGKNVYVAEVLKDISNQSILSIDNSRTEVLDSYEEEKDSLTGLYTRYYIDKQLSLEIRKNRLEQRPFTVLLAALTIEEESDTVDLLLSELALTVCGCFRTSQDWAGRYTGKVFLIALNDCTESQAGEFSRLIRKNFESRIQNHEHAGDSFKLNFGIQTLTEDISEAGAFLYLTFANLYNEAKPDT